MNLEISVNVGYEEKTIFYKKVDPKFNEFTVLVELIANTIVLFE